MLSRRLVATLALCALLGLLLVAWHAWQHRAGKVAAPAANVAQAAPAIAAPTAGKDVRPTPPLLAASASRAADTDNCGLHRLRRAEGEDDEAFQRRLETALKRPQEDLLRALAAQPDERSRAAGLLLSAYFVEPDAPTLATSGDASSAAGHAPEPPAAREARDALAHMATTTRDSFVYGLAAQACRLGDTQRHPGACQLLSYEQWTRIDPQNAAPWLFLAAQAQRHHDTEGYANAMRQVALARHIDLSFEKLPAVMLARVPADADATTQYGFNSLAYGITAAMPFQGYQTIMRYCGAPALDDANRRQSCEAIAGLLLERSNTLLDFSVGLSLAKRLSWPAPRIAELEQQRNAYYATQLDALAWAPETIQCADLDRWREYTRKLGEFGELGLMKREVRRSGRRHAELAQAYQARVHAMQQAASAAASAPRE